MVNKPKIKGTAAETAVVTYLREHGFPHAERRALSGTKDKGDVAGVPGNVLEIKNEKSISLGTWLKEALTERDNAKAKYGTVVHKRVGKGDPAEWYATMTLAQLTMLLREAGYGSPLPAPVPAELPEQQELVFGGHG